MINFNKKYNNSVTIFPTEVHGEISASPSKSMMIRALAASLLANGITTIYNSSNCIDSLEALNIIKELGAEITYPLKITNETERILIKGISEFDCEEKRIFCMESGLCLRMFSIIGGLFNKQLTFYGEGSLLRRPSLEIEKILLDLGAYCKSNNGFPPIVVKGQIKPNIISLDGSSSSQFISGLLFALPLLNGDSEIFVNNQKSKQYIDLSIKVLNTYNINIINDDYKHYYIKGNQEFKPCDIYIEGDWSSASSLLVAGAIAGSIKLSGLNIDSFQPDKKILEVLKSVGADVKISENNIEVIKKELNQFEYNAEDTPDLFPVLVALACNCHGKSIIHGVNRLINKESNRADSLYQEFKKMCANIIIKDDAMIISESTLKGGIVDSHNDHRIAMALAIAGLNASNSVLIQNPECVSKSYPDFFIDLKCIMR